MLPRLLAVACLLIALLAAVGARAAQPVRDDSSAGVRALWVTRTALATPATVARMVQAAERSGFNTLVLQVRGRGDAYYRSSLEPRASELAARPSFDPLAETLTLAQRAGMQVHAWVAVNLISGAVDLPTSRQHLIYRQPDWLMVPRQLAAELRTVDPRHPRYLGTLTRWTRNRRNEVEGLYVSPLHPWAAAHMAKVVGELVANYAIDGVHLDYVRFPSEDFDYSRAALQQFKVATRPGLADDERRRADAQDAIDPLAYPNLFRDRWLTFRQSRLTSLVAQVRDAAKAARPDVVISAAVVPNVTEAAETRLQDWRAWLDQSLIDVVAPMAYTQDVKAFERQIAEAQAFAGSRAVWAGIGAYRLSTTATLQHIATAQRLKADGIILFSYDALVAPPNSTASLAALGRAAFGPSSN